MEERYVEILLDIKSQVGALSAQNMEAARQRQRLEEGQRETREMLIPLVKDVEAVMPKVETLMIAHNRMGGVILTLTAVWGLIAGGAAYFSDAIKAKLHI